MINRAKINQCRRKKRKNKMWNGKIMLKGKSKDQKRKIDSGGRWLMCLLFVVF